MSSLLEVGLTLAEVGVHIVYGFQVAETVYPGFTQEVTMVVIQGTLYVLGLPTIPAMGWGHGGGFRIL